MIVVSTVYVALILLFAWAMAGCEKLTYYPDCASVHAAGKAPLLRGEPGYSRGLDADGDGVACQ